MKEKEWDVYVYGDVNIDLVIPGVEQFPAPGQEDEVDVMETFVGGGAALFTLGIGKLGLHPVFQATVGDDCYGQLILEELKKRNVDISLLEIAEKQKTGISISFTNEKDRSFLTMRGTNALIDIDNVKLEEVKKARHIHVTGYAGSANHDAYFRFLQKIKEEAQTTVSFDVVGFFLSMIFAPMVKITAENTSEVHATRCCLGYDFGSLLGAPLAGAVAVILAWKQVMWFGSVALILMGVICLLGFAGMERKGIVKYNQYERTKEKGSGSIKVLTEHDIIRFTLIAIVTGVIRTTVVFWIPTYLAQYLGFSADMSAGIYTVVTLLISVSSFLSVFIYERLGNNMNLTILIGFVVSTIAFVGTYLVHQRWVNIVLLVIAIVFEQCVSAMIWNRYCPGLRDTGRVSSATGFLDFCSYMAASVSSSLFANSVEQIGWGNLILIWAGLMFLGILIAIPYKKRK